VSKTGLVEEQEANPTRFDSSIEEADEVILHFRRSDVVASGWTVAEGLILTGGDGLTYRVTKVFPDHSVSIQRLRCRVTDLS
jgi:glycine cleavage system regulatory protein